MDDIEKAMTVITELYAKGEKVKDIAVALKRSNIKRPSGDANWTGPDVSRRAIQYGLPARKVHKKTAARELLKKREMEKQNRSHNTALGDGLLDAVKVIVESNLSVDSQMSAIKKLVGG